LPGRDPTPIEICTQSAARFNLCAFLSSFLRLGYWQYNSFAHIVQMAMLVRQGPFGGVARESPQGRKPIMGIFDKIKHAIFGGPANAA
jgi:hypothetical protein